MTRITNAEQVLTLLRAHLERAKHARGKPASTRASAKGARASALQRTRGISAADGLGPAGAARTLVSGLLEDAFGPELANDPKFQQMVDEVTAVLRNDEDGARLLDNAVAQVLGGR